MTEWKDDYNSLTRKRKLAMYIFLTTITCGIYAIYFMHKYISDINLICNGDKKESPNIAIVILFNIISCGFYQIYWIYVQENRMKNFGDENGIDIKETGSKLLIIYAFFYFLNIITSMVLSIISNIIPHMTDNISHILLIIIPIATLSIIVSLAGILYVWSVIIKNLNQLVEHVYSKKTA